MAAKFTNPLDNLKVASPCSQDWEAMIGDERKRFCSECRLNVYNLSGMTRPEAQNLIMSAEGRLCVRFYRRADGTVLTEDCPVGWAALKKRVSRAAAAFVSLFFGLFSSLGLMALFNQPKPQRPSMGMITYTPTPRHTPQIVTGEMPLMGNVAIPTPTPKPKATPKNAEMVVGRLVRKEIKSSKK